MAKKIGFKEFVFSKAGVYGSTEWQRKAQLAPERLNQFDEIVENSLKKSKEQ